MPGESAASAGFTMFGTKVVGNVHGEHAPVHRDARQARERLGNGPPAGGTLNGAPSE